MTTTSTRVALAALSLAATGAAAPAFAQDQSSLWNGWYVGANIGGNWGDNKLGASVAPGRGAIVIPPADVAIINAVGSNGSNKSGFTGGIEGGYNYQMGNWLFGLETDFVALDVNQRTSNSFQAAAVVTPPINPAPAPVTYTLSQRAQTDWMWSVRPRIGYVAGPWLVYGTAGIATSDIKVSLNFTDTRSPPNTVTADDSSTKTGWIAGLGAGYAFSPRWSVKGEWLYADFGSISTTATSPAGFVSLTSEAKVRSNILRVGADYRF